MTYSRSLQGRFATGKYTPLALLLSAAVLWGVALFFMPPLSHVLQIEMGKLPAIILSILCYAAVALMLNTTHLYERRISWLAPLYIFLTALAVPYHNNASFAVTVLLFFFLVRVLMACHPGEGAEGSLFSAFALLCIFSFLLPQFVYLLPLFVIYMLITGVTGVRKWLSAMLGMAMPFWFLYGILYVWPELAEYVPSYAMAAKELAFPELARITPVRILYTVAELGVMLPAMVFFAGSSVPGKPYLRKRLMFIMLVNACLLLFSWLSEPNFSLLFVWRLPGIAIMATYLFSSRITRLSNIYFIVLVLFWFTVAVLDIWLN